MIYLKTKILLYWVQEIDVCKYSRTFDYYLLHTLWSAKAVSRQNHKKRHFG